MTLPLSNSIELPILQELAAIGGTDELQFLYERLVGYFPQIDDVEVNNIKNGNNKFWRKSVQKAGKNLDEQNYIRRARGLWTITQKGLEIVQAETSSFALPSSSIETFTHLDIQKLLVEIGEFLNYSAEVEFEYYDVVWRENSNQARLSHIFEVQSKGNIDSAFAKLKRAYQMQRTKPFLVLTSERDLNRARQSLVREFQEIEKAVTILTFVQIRQIHNNLKSIGEILPKLLTT